MKRLIAVLLVLITVLGTFAACGGKGGNKTNNGGASGENVTLTIGLPANAFVLDYKNNALTKYLEEKTGYTLEFIPYSGGTDIKTQISTAVTSGQDLPDIIWDVGLGDKVITKYGDDGYFIDLQDYFADRDGASKVFWDRVEENLSKEQQEELVRLMTEAESGAIYAVPGTETSLVDNIDYQVWINTKWLDAVNMEMPTSTDELYQVLVAFKNNDCNGNGSTTDEIPLYGSEAGGIGADVINWIVNQFVYNDEKSFNVDNNGKLYFPNVTEEYRNAMKFLNKLYKEGLMPDAVLGTGSGDLSKVNTPSSNVAMAGIFVGHLTLHATKGNPVLAEYAPLPQWNPVVINTGNLCLRKNYITESCENPDAAFNLMMTMWEEESSYRIRYGEYGVNWDYADEGAVSDLGIPAVIKIINDPLNTQNTCLWSSAGCTMNVYAEGEAAHLAQASTDWEKMKSQMHAESRKLADASNEKYMPSKKCPSLVYTYEENEATELMREACKDLFGAWRADFIKGLKNPDTDWNEYLAALDEQGLQTWLKLGQKAYDRQTK